MVAQDLVLIFGDLVLGSFNVVGCTTYDGVLCPQYEVLVAILDDILDSVHNVGIALVHRILVPEHIVFLSGDLIGVAHHGILVAFGSVGVACRTVVRSYYGILLSYC